MWCAFHLSFPFLFAIFMEQVPIFMEQARADGKGKLATSRPRADSGGEKVKNVRRHSLDRLHASMNKQKKKKKEPKAIFEALTRNGLARRTAKVRHGWCETRCRVDLEQCFFNTTP
jgi:hypothetical protein